MPRIVSDIDSFRWSDNCRSVYYYCIATFEWLFMIAKRKRVQRASPPASGQILAAMEEPQNARLVDFLLNPL